MDKFRAAYWFQQKKRIFDRYRMRSDILWNEHDEALEKLQAASGVGEEQWDALYAGFREQDKALWIEYDVALAKAWQELTSGKP